MRSMKLILTQDVEKLGDMGEVVTVKPGFARNYLIPRSLGVVANEAKVKEIEHYKEVLLRRKKLFLLISVLLQRRSNLLLLLLLSKLVSQTRFLDL